MRNDQRSHQGLGDLPKIIVICGPTGIGKTSTSINLCLDFRGEIIGADSMQLYRYMNIGTAKPTHAETEIVPHHMIDIIDPDEPFDAAAYGKMAADRINTLISRKITPFIVGGTGLYIKALIHGLSRARPADPEVLAQLKDYADTKGAMAIHERLSQYDPDAAKRIHPNDTFRVIRALEIFQVTGKSISQYHDDHKFLENRFNALKIGLELPREILYQRINTRVDAMIQGGLLSEVKDLLEKGYLKDLKSMQSIGYRHMTEFLMQKVSWEDAINTLKRDTRRYAKRQMTWFKADPEIRWFKPDQQVEMHHELKKFLLF